MKYASLFLLLTAGVTLAGFVPSARIDHQNLPNHLLCHCAIAVGPGGPSSQPIYVAFEDDSMAGISCVRTDVWFQKSTNAGRTWLPEDLLIQRGNRYASSPDITIDLDGNVFIVYCVDSFEQHHIRCVRSSDGGTNWSAPVQIDDNDAGVYIGWARIAAGADGNLLCAWNGGKLDNLHIFSSVSTDRGTSWSQPGRVDDDTTNEGCYHADVFVQPGTNHYLVAAQVPRYEGHAIRFHACLYRSTDAGQTFQSGVQLDTFGGSGQPHVVADQSHVICDYTGEGSSGLSTTEARTLYTPPDTWGRPLSVAKLGTMFQSYVNGAKLALSADGRVHTALMICDTIKWHYLIYYAFSSDHGVSWSYREIVSDNTTANQGGPDIAADSAGHVYVAWQENGRMWFATNHPTGIAEGSPQQRTGVQPLATVVRNVLVLHGPENGNCPPERLRPTRRGEVPISHAALLDISGRKVMELKPGANDVSRVSPGVYLVSEPGTGAQALRKVVIAR